MPTVRLNDLRFDYSSIEVNFAGARFGGIKAISYNDGLEAGVVRGSPAQIIGMTRGQYTAEGNFEMYREDYDDLTTLLIAKGAGAGIYEVSFDINVTFSEISSNITQNDVIKGARIKKVDSSNQLGSDASAVRVDFGAKFIVWNGKNPLGVAQQLGARF